MPEQIQGDFHHGENLPAVRKSRRAFSTDTEVTCDKCGFVIYNDMLSCVQWCKYARKCVGDQMYEQMMEIAKHNKEKAAKERAEKAAAKAQ